METRERERERYNLETVWEGGRRGGVIDEGKETTWNLDFYYYYYYYGQ